MMEDNFKWNDELVKEFAKKFDAFECTPTDNDISKFKQSKKQSVESKDFEIVDGYKKCIDGSWTGEVLVRTIRRLSDNETFSIDELTQAGNRIHSFEFKGDLLLANMGSFKVPLEDLVKRKNENKDWEIIEKSRKAYEGEKGVIGTSEWAIKSVRRLSDNSVWSVDENFYNNGAGIYTEEKIKSFEVVNSVLHVHPHEGGYYLLQHLHKIKQPLFTTEDMQNAFNAARITLYPDVLNEKVFKYQSYWDYNS